MSSLSATSKSAPSLAPLYDSVSHVWKSTLYEQPDAPPSAQAVALGRQLAVRLLDSQALYVADLRTKTVTYVSPGITRLLGHSPEQFAAQLYDLVHPDDRPIITAASVLANSYCVEHIHAGAQDYILSIDYRVQHAQGHYVRVLRQNLVLQCEANGAFISVAGILTDISHHKLSDDVRFHLNQPDFPDYVRRQQVRALPVALSLREQEVLLLVLAGHSSCQIAHQLGLSVYTVNTHRRNLRRKVGSYDLHHLLRHLDTEGIG